MLNGIRKRCLPHNRAGREDGQDSCNNLTEKCVNFPIVELWSQFEVLILKNSLPGEVEQKSIAERCEEVEDAQFVHLSTQIFLPALNKQQTMNDTSECSPA